MEDPAFFMVEIELVYYNIYVKRILIYFHHLKTGDDRGIKNTKWAAVVCLVFALVAPALYNVITFMVMMR